MRYSRRDRRARIRREAIDMLKQALGEVAATHETKKDIRSVKWQQ